MVALTISGALEVVWVSGLKHSDTWWQWIITIASIIFSFKVFDSAAKLPIGTVYGSSPDWGQPVRC